MIGWFHYSEGITLRDDDSNKVSYLQVFPSGSETLRKYPYK